MVMKTYLHKRFGNASVSGFVLLNFCYPLSGVALSRIADGQAMDSMGLNSHKNEARRNERGGNCFSGNSDDNEENHTDSSTE